MLKERNRLVKTGKPTMETARVMRAIRTERAAQLGGQIALGPTPLSHYRLFAHPAATAGALGGAALMAPMLMSPDSPHADTMMKAGAALTITSMIAPLLQVNNLTGKLSSLFTGLIGLMPALVGGIKAVGIAIKGAFLANPVGVVLVALTALAAAAYTFRDKWIGAFKDAFNAVAERAANFVNFFIRQINSIPFLSGIFERITGNRLQQVTWGGHVPKRMHTGGVVHGPTEILAGEAGPEAIIPLDQADNLFSMDALIDALKRDTNATLALSDVLRFDIAPSLLGLKAFGQQQLDQQELYRADPDTFKMFEAIDMLEALGARWNPKDSADGKTSDAEIRSAIKILGEQYGLKGRDALTVSQQAYSLLDDYEKFGVGPASLGEALANVVGERHPELSAKRMVETIATGFAEETPNSRRRMEGRASAWINEEGRRLAREVAEEELVGTFRTKFRRDEAIRLGFGPSTFSPLRGDQVGFRSQMYAGPGYPSELFLSREEVALRQARAARASMVAGGRLRFATGIASRQALSPTEVGQLLMRTGLSGFTDSGQALRWLLEEAGVDKLGDISPSKLHEIVNKDRRLLTSAASPLTADQKSSRQELLDRLSSQSETADLVGKRLASFKISEISASLQDEFASMIDAEESLFAARQTVEEAAAVNERARTLALDGSMRAFDNAVDRFSRIMNNGVHFSVDIKRNDKGQTVVETEYGTVTHAGVNIGHIPGFAEGGIVTKPTLGVFGEAGPEALIPLNKLGGGVERPTRYQTLLLGILDDIRRNTGEQSLVGSTTNNKLSVVTNQVAQDFSEEWAVYHQQVADGQAKLKEVMAAARAKHVAQNPYADAQAAYQEQVRDGQRRVQEAMKEARARHVAQNPHADAWADYQEQVREGQRRVKEAMRRARAEQDMLETAGPPQPPRPVIVPTEEARQAAIQEQWQRMFEQQRRIQEQRDQRQSDMLEMASQARTVPVVVQLDGREIGRAEASIATEEFGIF